ncbi:MAG: ElyC/SanA/YdcF family protein [Candidatus Sungiibacteriota bacterium]
MTVLVVIACHFKSRNELCDTTIARLQRALGIAWELSPEKPIFMVGGNIPYEKGGPTLQHLMTEWLTECGVEKHRIIFNEGTGTFSEGRESTRMLAALRTDRVCVVSSNWWLWSGMPIWRRFAGGRGLTMEAITARKTGGWRTRLTYAVYAMIVRASFLLGTSSVVERRLNAMQAKRLEGFTWNGCA